MDSLHFTASSLPCSSAYPKPIQHYCILTLSSHENVRCSNQPDIFHIAFSNFMEVLTLNKKIKRPPQGQGRWVSKKGNAIAEISNVKPLQDKGVGLESFFFKNLLCLWRTLRKTALPQRSSLREVNWWTRHLCQAQLASSYSRSLHVHSASKIGFTKK